MEIRNFEIKVGADKPFYAFHITDDHICLADASENERKRELAGSRANHFTDGRPEMQLQTASQMLSKVREENIPLIHTGDLIDFVSRENLYFAGRYFDGIDAIVCSGNHEFSQYVGEAFEDEEYKRQSLESVEKAYPDGIEFGTRIINGVKFITLDDVYYYVLPETLERLENELKDGVPTVLVIHNPVYSVDTYRTVMNGKSVSDPPYLAGCPAELLKSLSEDRIKQQTPDETTVRFVEICNTAENIKAVICGHLHDGYVSKLDNGAIQISAAAAFKGVMNRYKFV